MVNEHPFGRRLRQDFVINCRFRCSSSNHNQRFASWSIRWRNTSIGPGFPICRWKWRSLPSWMEARQGHNESWSKGLKRIFFKAIRDLNDWNTLITDTFEGKSSRPTIISLKFLTKKRTDAEFPIHGHNNKFDVIKTTTISFIHLSTAEQWWRT